MLVSPGCHTVMTFNGRFRRIQLKKNPTQWHCWSHRIIWFSLEWHRGEFYFKIFAPTNKKFELNSAYSHIFIDDRLNIEALHSIRKGNQNIFPHPRVSCIFFICFYSYWSLTNKRQLAQQYRTAAFPVLHITTRKYNWLKID